MSDCPHSTINLWTEEAYSACDGALDRWEVLYGKLSNRDEMRELIVVALMQTTKAKV